MRMFCSTWHMAIKIQWLTYSRLIYCPQSKRRERLIVASCCVFTTVERHDSRLLLSSLWKRHAILVQSFHNVNLSYLSTHTVCQCKIQFFFLIILGGYGHIGKWIQENTIFMRFCCCFKLSKKIEKLSNEQPMNAIIKFTLAVLSAIGEEISSEVRIVIWSCACIFSTTLLLPFTATRADWNSKCLWYQRGEKKTPACIREIQVHKLWTKVYSQQGLTAMACCVASHLVV